MAEIEPSVYIITASLHTTNKHKAYLCKWWQNGTRCRDGVKVLWCHSHLVWLVFEASIHTCACFPSENFLSLVNKCMFINCDISNNKHRETPSLYTNSRAGARNLALFPGSPGTRICIARRAWYLFYVSMT